MSVSPRQQPLKNAAASAGRPPARDAAVALPERLAVALLGVMAVVAPLLLGSTGEWPRLGIELVMTAAVTAWALSKPRAWVAATIPVLAAAVFLLQLVPLSDRVLTALSPVSAGAWKVALQGDSRAAGSISIVPSETLAGCGRLLLGLAAIVAVGDFARRPATRQWLLWSLAATAVLLVVLGLVFPVSYDDKILLGFIDLKGPLEFWRSPIPPPAQTAGWTYLDWTRVGGERYPVDLKLVGDGFGPYISTNEFAAAVYLTLPAVLALFMRLSRGRVPDAARYAIVVALVAGALAVVGGLAKSRAGAASLFMGSMVFVTAAMETPWARRACAIATGAVAVGLLGFALAFHGLLNGLVGIAPEAAQQRLLAMQGEGRQVAAQVALRMFRASPLLGTGLGSYGDLNARMLGGTQAYYFAHNDYAQLLAEGGLAGLALMVAGAVVLVIAVRRFWRLPPGADRLEGAAAWAALAAIGAHSAFDWNMHVPANAFLACLMGAIAIGPILPQASPAVAGGRWSRIRPWLAGGMLVAACLGSAALLARTASSEAASRELRQAIAADQLAAKDPAKPDPAPFLRAAVARGEAAAARDPRNASLGVSLGQANLHLAARSGADETVAAAYRSAATRWFTLARKHSAAARGFPEPVPQPSATR